MSNVSGRGNSLVVGGSVRGTVLLKLEEILGKNRVLTGGCFIKHQIRPDRVGNYEDWLSYRSVACMLQCEAEVGNMPDLGMALGAQQGLKLLGPLYHLATSAPTVQKTIDVMEKYFSFYNSSVFLSLVRDKGAQCVQLCFAHRLPNSFDYPQALEKILLQACMLIDDILGGGFRPKAILFRHNQQSSMSRYFRYFGCEVHFNQSVNAIVFGEEDLYKSTVGCDPLLHELIDFYLDHNFDAGSSVAEMVSEQIHLLLPQGRCSLEQISSYMGNSLRTLQRRLAEEGESFEGLVEKIRRGLAMELLGYTSLKVNRIASELGYRRVASFCRAHYRWYGFSPQVYRKKMRVFASSGQCNCSKYISAGD